MPDEDERRQRWAWPELLGCVLAWLVGIFAALLIAWNIYNHLTH